MLQIDLYNQDCLELMKTLADDSLDAIVTDPPYGLKFMGKNWDHGIPGEPYWKEALRICKPGAHLLAFGGPRTFHRLACAIEDAGWEIRDDIEYMFDLVPLIQEFYHTLNPIQQEMFATILEHSGVSGCLSWIYGSGFPKSMDVSKAIDKSFGVDREDKYEGAFDRFAGPTGNKKCDECGKWLHSGNRCMCPRPQDDPITAEAKQWEGWGTSLKPAWEPIIFARKPLKGKVVDNVLEYGVGAINIDASRIPTDDKLGGGAQSSETIMEKIDGWDRPWMHDEEARKRHMDTINKNVAKAEELGRFPANIILDEYAGTLLDQQSGNIRTKKIDKPSDCSTDGSVFSNQTFQGNRGSRGYTDNGGASRFFYCPKASRTEREAGLDKLPKKPGGSNAKGYTDDVANGQDRNRPVANHHPTVKPIALMQYLIKMIAPKGSTVFDPFMGSGTTGCAAVLEGMNFIGCDLEEDYVNISRERINHWKPIENPFIDF